MSRRKYLYRVIATYAEAHLPTRVWHYQSLTAARRRKLNAERGYSETWGEGEPGSTISIPPAELVTVERSEPIAWQSPGTWVA